MNLCAHSRWYAAKRLQTCNPKHQVGILYSFPCCYYWSSWTFEHILVVKWSWTVAWSCWDFSVSMQFVLVSSVSMQQEPPAGAPASARGGWYKYTCTHNTMFGFHCVVLTTIWNGSLGGWVLLSNASWNTKSLKVRGLKKSEPLTLNPFLFINFKCSNRKGKLCSQKRWPPLVGG